MNRERIEAMIAEIESIVEDAGEEPIRYDFPKDHGYREAINISKLAAVMDILRAIVKDL